MKVRMSDKPKTVEDILKNDPERWKGLYSALKTLILKGHHMEKYQENADDSKEEFRCRLCGRFATFELIDDKLSKSGSAIGRACNGVSHKK